MAQGCILHREIANDRDIDTLQIDLDRMGEGTVENAVKINPGKSKVVGFTRARLKNLLNYLIGDEKFPEANSCKYLRIILRSD